VIDHEEITLEDTVEEFEQNIDEIEELLNEMDQKITELKVYQPTNLDRPHHSKMES
jgi:hypothetical protein